MGMGTFIVNHPDFGWQAFGGNVVSTSPTVQVQVKDSIRRRVYIAPLGTMLSLDAGAFSVVAFNPSSRQVDVTITAAPDGASSAAAAPNGRLQIQQKATISGFGGLRPSASLSTDAGAFVVPRPCNACCCLSLFDYLYRCPKEIPVCINMFSHTRIVCYKFVIVIRQNQSHAAEVSWGFSSDPFSAESRTSSVL
jgi:hypothetical protein